jgi:hypothetical protein
MSAELDKLTREAEQLRRQERAKLERELTEAGAQYGDGILKRLSLDDLEKLAAQWRAGARERKP